ncbi:MAG: hypothetical protein CMB47_03375 [Euryarchaeota archaeon]|nr:hypothetical protein [Euryarchaeota archaeon]|tara:strand:+ start:6691 stop:7980 length:1290 start_codon:yes stop_codon:yes gene_type:complete
MKRPVVLVTAPVATRSGYGARSRDVVSALLKLDKYDVKIFTVPWGSTPQNALVIDNPRDKAIFDCIIKDQKDMPQNPDVHIHIVVPNEFTPVGKYNIGITAGLEASAIPQSWIEGCNRMDLVLASSKFSVDVMKQTIFSDKESGNELKIVKPVDVLFEGADTDIFFKKQSGSEYSKDLHDVMSQIKENWNFLFVGHWLQGNEPHDRKDVSSLIRTFFATFKGKKNTGLILKTSGASTSVMDREEILAKIRDIKLSTGVPEDKLPNVYLLHADLYDDEVNDLYNHPKVKAHISFTHGEGYGRPLLEASLSGKPVIAPNWSGHVDFIKSPNSILLPGKMTKIDKQSLPEGIYLDGQQWFTVNYQAAAQVMLEVRKNYKKHKLNAMKQSMYSRGHYSFNKMVTRLGKILDDNLPKFTETVIPKINLPKLEKV